MKTAELKTAYFWICDECGIDNFARAVKPEFSDEDLEEIRNEHGVQPWETGSLVTIPEQVTCTNCGETFRTFDDQ